MSSSLSSSTTSRLQASPFSASRMICASTSSCATLVQRPGSWGSRLSATARAVPSPSRSASTHSTSSSDTALQTATQSAHPGSWSSSQLRHGSQLALGRPRDAGHPLQPGCRLPLLSRCGDASRHRPHCWQPCSLLDKPWDDTLEGGEAPLPLHQGHARLHPSSSSGVLRLHRARPRWVLLSSAIY